VLTTSAGGEILRLSTPRPLKAMSEEQLKAFLEAVKADAGVQEQLKAAADADAVVAIAKETGFIISADDLKNALSEISDEELEGVTGGAAGHDRQHVFEIGVRFFNSNPEVKDIRITKEFVVEGW